MPPPALGSRWLKPAPLWLWTAASFIQLMSVGSPSKTRSSVVLSLAVVLISRDSSLLDKILVPKGQRAVITLPKAIRVGKGPYYRNYRCISDSMAGSSERRTGRAR